MSSAGSKVVLGRPEWLPDEAEPLDFLRRRDHAEAILEMRYSAFDFDARGPVSAVTGLLRIRLSLKANGGGWALRDCAGEYAGDLKGLESIGVSGARVVNES